MHISEYFLVLSVFEIYINAILYVFCDLVCIFLKLHFKVCKNHQCCMVALVYFH